MRIRARAGGNNRVNLCVALTDSAERAKEVALGLACANGGTSQYRYQRKG